MIIVPDVEAIMNALLALLATTPGAVTVTRTWVPWDQVAQINQPAIVIAEPSEHVTDRRGQQPSTKLDVLLVCYVKLDPADAVAPPTTRLNTLISAIKTTLIPSGPDIARNVQTLGNRVSNCFVDGKIIKDPGIIDNQGSVLIPVTILIS